MTERKRSDEHVIARNRAATFHYELSDQYEAGIVLRGSEVKSLREGRVHLIDAFAVVERGEVWLKNLHIASFFHARAFPHDERSARKLLLHAREIQQIERVIMREGYTLVPLDLHFRNGHVKVALGVGRGKKVHDKRAAIAERTEEREALQELRARQRRGG
ncbi:SsrA-binding protein SmpB [Polyangium sp. y55x31]|uniref:SsrA-binding protein SmpB n=1 Tax=Polyangium sp. y55x31 TaxID=3042688 RepID=UPI002482242C|nr:SsrA-binding protein SmpB [Polyangium sp. y55x31]MDI1476244.1 SsrA-binding protein SmpB [Polyangium sp. y55x31]